MLLGLTSIIRADCVKLMIQTIGIAGHLRQRAFSVLQETKDYSADLEMFLQETVVYHKGQVGSGGMA